ncbi:MAG: penicillin-binding transpeptidase domain-containing protein [Bacteroidales bacterium]
MTDYDNKRKKYIIIGVCIVFMLLIIQLFNIQIIDKSYKINAQNNALKYITRYPVRGLILDRNNQILAGNKMTYNILVTPYDLKPFDTLALCEILDMEKTEMLEKLNYYHKYRTRIGYQTLVFKHEINKIQYSRFIEQRDKFPGFSSIARTARSYPFNAGANLLGYVSEVSPSFLKKHPSYKPGDYAGMTGLEKECENTLKGEKGYNIFLRDSRNKIQAPYKNGTYDKSSVPGKEVVSTIDAQLQNYGERLMKNKVGSVVAIEPSTGEILSMISSPGIDVSILADIGKHYSEIVNDPYKPMYNRAIMSPQPPGSTFKLVNGLIGLQDDVVSPNTLFSCHSGYSAPGIHVGCHSHRSPIDFKTGIMMSCNSYFCQVFRKILEDPKYANEEEAYNHWYSLVKTFGFGSKLGIDISSEQAGNIPTSKYYNKVYGKHSWNALTIISLSIGQGEIGATPLQLANLAAIMANRGYYYTPHILKSSSIDPENDKYRTAHNIPIDKKHFETVIEGMHEAVNGNARGERGTASWAKLDSIDVCGKTGTAQNPHGDDHSVFICFAPRENPKIAIAVYIENAGFGSTWAVPVASFMVEKYLKGKISPNRKWLEDKILNADLLNKVPAAGSKQVRKHK